MKSFKILFITILAFIAFSVETDVYVPSLPNMVEALGISETNIQMILSVNFFGICLSCLLSGPLSDSFGRKKTLSIGTGLFALASLGCYLSNDFQIILLSRFIQGIGAGTILSVANNCIFDVYHPSKSQQLIAILNAITTIAMSMAPLIGVWINIQFGWKASFLFILLLATSTWIAITIFLPETLPHNKRLPFELRNIFKNYLTLFKTRTFILGTAIWCLMFAVLIVYTANASLLFIKYLHVSETSFGYYQSIIMGAFALSSFLCSYLVAKLGNDLVKFYGTALFFLGIFCLIFVNFFYQTSPLLISIAMALIVSGTAIAVVIYFTNSMIGIANAGAAVSLAQAIRLFVSSELTELSRVLFNGTLTSVVIPIVAVAAGVSLCIILLPRTQQNGIKMSPQAII